MYHRLSARTTLRHLLCAMVVPASIGTSLLGCAPSTPSTPYVDTSAPGCTGKRWIGRPSVCAPVTIAPGTVWNASPLFRQLSPNPHPTLGDYCLYTWASTTTDPTTADVNDFQSAVGGMVSEDCVVVGPLTPEEEQEALVNDQVRSWLAEELLRAAGGLDELPLPSSSSERARVRIAVADTSPESTSGPIPLGNSHHGYSMGWIAQRLACPPEDDTCRASVTTHLALPRVTNDKVDLNDGGYFGTPGELALAIQEAVDLWRQQASDNRAGQQRLVLNLSLGWQPAGDDCETTHDGAASPDGSPLQLDRDAVFDALTHAACNGVLVIAAAGNDPGGAYSDGPTCPAAWQRLPAPTEAECKHFEGQEFGLGLPSELPLLPPDDTDLELHERPLLFGVGGVDYTGLPLATTRRGSLARHAAIAFGGVSSDPAATTPLPTPLTGSSTSAAIATGAAAALWAYRPDMTGHEIMKLLYDTGSPVEGYSPDLNNPAPEIAAGGPLHRISLCHALSELCSLPSPEGADPACESPPVRCADPAVSAVQNPVLSPHLLQSIDSFYAAVEPLPAGPSLNLTPANQEYQNYLTAPWTEPSPSQPLCGGPCLLNVPLRRLMVSINPSSSHFSDSPLTNMTLVLEDTMGQQHVVAPAAMSIEGRNVMPASGLGPGDKIVLDDIDLPEGIQPVRGMLVFQMQNPNQEIASVVEPLLLTTGQPAPLAGR